MACVTQRERHACVQRGIRTSVLEAQVGAWLATVKIPATWRADMERLQAELTGPPKARIDDQARIVGQITRLQELYELGHIAGGREEYIARRRVLETELTGAPVTSIAPVSVLEQAKRLLDDLADLWARANAQERSDICQTMFAEVRVRDQAIVGAALARPEYLPLIASSEASSRLAVSVAPPDGLRGAVSKVSDPLAWYSAG